MIESFIHNPVKVSVGVLIVALFGVVGLLSMPMQLTPEVQTPTLTIETTWPGASPQEVEREIIQEQEEQIKSVEGLTKLSSQSMDSMGQITLEFSIGTNMEEALLKVNTKLQQVREYPEDADQPVINTSNSGDRPIAWFILTVRPPDAAQYDKFLEEHPQHAAVVTRIRTTENAGLRLLRLREFAAEHPEANVLLPADKDVTTFRRFCEDFIEAEFERVPGVSNSNVIGGREDEVQVIVDPEKLAARRLTIADVRRALRDQNADTSGGDFWEGKRRYVIRTLGQFRTLKQVEDVILTRIDGQPVYVRDIGRAEFGFRKPDGIVRRFGNSCIAINAARETGANILDVMDGLRKANDKLNAEILAQEGLLLSQVYDETEYIYSSINLVNSNIVFGGLLTVVCLMLFLKSVRSTIIIGLAIPTSIIGTFLVLAVLGRTLNVISLAGMAFAVGMLVDNAVVVLENIYQHHQMGKTRFRAIVDATNEVWAAVLSSTLTTLAVFVPVIFVQEEAGQLFRDIALAISAAIALSLIVSVVVVPTAAFRILSEYAAAPKPPARWSLARVLALAATVALTYAALLRWPNYIVEVLTVAVAALLLIVPLDRFGTWFSAAILWINRVLQKSTLLQVGTVAGITAASILLSWKLMPRAEYLPNGNRNLVIAILLPPPGYNLDQLVAMGDRLEGELRKYYDVDPGSPEALALDAPAIADFFFVARGRMVFMGIRAADPLAAGQLVNKVRQVGLNSPGMFAIASQASLFEQGLEGGRKVDIEITGPELPKLFELGGMVMGKIYGRPPQGDDPGAPGVLMTSQAFPRPSLDASNPEMHVLPKWEQAADMGMSAADMGYVVDALVDGAYATDFFLGGDKIDLRILGEERFASQSEQIEALPVATPAGQLVPLAAVANVVHSSGPEQINHRERLRNVTIQVTPPPEMAIEEAMQIIQTQIVSPLQAEGHFTGGYYMRLAGTADKLRSTWAALWFNLLLALLITYLLMAALFESWVYPFVVIFSVPLGAVGGILAIQLLNLFVLQPLDILTMLGFVILIGTVVNNPILIVEQALVYIRTENRPRRDAILESVRSRIRPIFMTTTTTTLGLLPLVLMPGAGAELYRGLGSVVLGGLVVSTLVTLILIPALFLMMMDAKAFVWTRLGWHDPDLEETRQSSAAPAPAVSHDSGELPATNGHGSPYDVPEEVGDELVAGS